METHINVTLHDGGRIRDLRIPTHIEVRRLIKELDGIFEKENARKKYQLHVVNKGFVLDEGKVLADYPVTTGDIVEVLEV
ncbi:TPA: EsaB/YukD family protein [Streptococcus suis]